MIFIQSEIDHQVTTLKCLPDLKLVFTITKMALLPFIGHVISVVMLLSAAYTIKLIDWLTRFFVNIVKSLTDADIEKDRRTWHPQREISDIVYTGYSLSE